MRVFILTLCLSFYISLLSASQIAVVTIAAGDDYKSMVNIGTESKKKYCQEHGYDFIFIQESADTSRRIYWSKILAVLKAMENPAYDWVVWMDADTLIMNHGISLEDLIDQRYNMLIAKDFQGVNSGVFFLRNCEWSRQFLQNVYARTDCLTEWLPEQTAIARVLEQRKYGKRTKIVPQRLFNAYAPELSGSDLKASYQVGDFLLHFASARDQQLLSLFQKYAPQAINNPSLISLDFYLGCYGFRLSPLDSPNNEGYMSNEQRQMIGEWLKQFSYIESIAEIGLNGGHSAETFFKSCPNLKKFTSFDLNHHPYTAPAADFFKRTYNQAFEFIQGDSKISVPTYTANHPEQLFDLICIDGDHSFNGCKTDILNCQKFAHPDTILLIDDYVYEVYAVVQELQRNGIIKVIQSFSVEGPHGGRVWIEARYL